MNFNEIEKALISEIKLDSLQAKLFILLTTEGKMNEVSIAKKLEIPNNVAIKIAKELIDLGALIDMPNNEFEAMHPRFTAVNMFRKRCEKEKIEFKQNKTVDNIGVFLEKFYENARTK